MHNLLEIIKGSALDAVENSKPMAVVIGVVESIEPLRIKIEQKSILEQDDLLLIKNVTDYWASMTVDHETEDDDTLNTLHSHPDVAEASFDSHHAHRYAGKKEFRVHNSLKEGEGVILLRVQGDQQYIVLDRVINP